VLFSDEVYRELEHDPADRPGAACDLYERAVSLGSISKTYGLPGLRIGWLATRDEALREAIAGLKHYTTICSSAPSELLVALVLRHRQALIDANLASSRETCPCWRSCSPATRARSSGCGRPRARSGFRVSRSRGADVEQFCRRLAAAGVLLLPGTVYDEPRHVRVGFGRGDLPEALDLLEKELKTLT
jgi:aspartate/methionine/tyrosine aminotransferase